MIWRVTLEVETTLRPTDLAVMVNMFPGVIDARVDSSELIARDKPTNTNQGGLNHE